MVLSFQVLTLKTMPASIFARLLENLADLEYVSQVDLVRLIDLIVISSAWTGFV